MVWSSNYDRYTSKIKPFYHQVPNTRGKLTLQCLTNEEGLKKRGGV